MGIEPRALEDVVTLALSGWQDRSVLVTGHTGFKGGWLALWLQRLGARVHGFALDPPTNPSLFEVAGLRALCASDTRADLSELEALRSCIQISTPEIVFHLAAQPLVKHGYRDPLMTLRTNVMGTAHVLEAARFCESVRAVVVVTTDKVYRNNETGRPYHEHDPLGGHDPYSASKAAAELVAASYRASFHSSVDSQTARVATARAGNVIGGGDWGEDRLVPDCLRAFRDGRAVTLRYPASVRPWQHVLDPLAGYLLLAEQLLGTDGRLFAEAWNFGPDAGGDATVCDVAETLARLWADGGRVSTENAVPEVPEARTLRLDSSRARRRLGWSPRWSLEEALKRTVLWQRAWMEQADMMDFSLRQIADYESGS